MKFLIVARSTAFSHNSEAYYRLQYGMIRTRPEIAGTFGWYWDKALKALGHETAVFIAHWSERIDAASPLYHRAFQLKWRLRSYVADMSRKASQGLLNAVEQERPDVVLVDAGEHLDPDVLARLKQQFRPLMAIYLMDDPVSQRWTNVMRALSLYDVIGSFDSQLVEQYRRATRAAVLYLPCACDPDVYHPRELSAQQQQRYGADVAFVGTLQDGRAALLEAIRDRQPAIWTWNRRALRRYPALAPLYRGFVHGEQASWVYQASRISLNVHHPQTRSGTNMRTFEIAAAGGFQLVDDHPGIRDHFQVGKDIVTYHDAADLKDKLQYYLEHDAERREIARACTAKVRTEHSFLQRMRVLCEALVVAGRCA